MPNYVRQPYKLTCRGLGLRHPPDLLPDGLYPILNNMSVRTLGSLQPRAGITQLSANNYGSAVHSIRRLNDPTNSTFARILGAGTSVFDTTSTSPIDTGYSGNPLSMVPFRPNQTPRPWMYISDGTRSRKIRTDRTNYPQGIAPPTQQLQVTRGVPQFNIIEQFNSTGSWTNTSTAGSISTPNRFNTTITAILYDTGSTGWACITPAAADKNFQPGAIIIFNATENVMIRQVFEPITATTIAAIQYDSGSTGLCSIVLTDQSTGLQPDAMVQLAAAEYVRVLSVSIGVDGTVSFRCSTASTRSVGNAVAGVASFRAYTVGTFSASNTLTGKCFSTTVSTGIGYLSLDTHSSPLNEAIAFPNGSGSGQSRPIQPTDYVHISLQVDNPAAITNIRLVLNIDPSFPSLTSIQNAYYKDISPSVFQGVINNTLTAFASQQSALQQGVINSAAIDANNSNNPLLNAPVADITSGDPTGGLDTTPSATPNIDYTVPGNSAWTEFKFKVGEMSPIGSTQTTSLAAVTGLILIINTTASVTFLVSSWWIGGTYGLDSQGSLPYIFYERFRSSTTGARSNPGPILRAPVDFQREQALITPQTSADTQVDKIDIFAYGATLDQPRLAASVANAGTQISLNVTDAAIKTNETLSFKNFQPFPISDLPRTGTCNVFGTSVTQVSGDSFNTSWETGSEIIINGSVYTLYARPASASRLELIENAGALTGATFFIPEATIGSQPLPSMAGPDPATGCLLAVGDPKNAGKLYWSNPNDPDSAADDNELEITSPSEPLQAVFIYDGRAYVYSTERLFSCFGQTRTDPVTGIQSITYGYQEVPNSKGLYGIYAYAVMENFYSVAKNGIWETGNAGIGTITDESLYPLFPHKGQVGTAVNGYQPIDFTQPNALRLFSTKTAVFFNYIDTNSNYQTMLYDRALPQPGWFPLQYTPQPRCFYEEEGPTVTSVLMGGSNGLVYQVGLGLNDNGTAIAFDFYTRSVDGGDSRLQKLWLDYMLDADPASVTLTLTPVMNNLLTALPSATIVGFTGRQLIQEPLTTSPLALYLNVSIHIQGSANGTTPVFYEIQPNGVLQPYLEVNMTSPNYISHGYTTYGHIRDGFFTYISTAPVNVTILTDTGLTYSFVLPSSSGVITKKYVPLAALKGLLFYYSATAITPFAIFTDETIIHVKEWGSTAPFQSFKPFQGQSL